VFEDPPKAYGKGLTMKVELDYNLGDELTRKSGEAYSWLDNERKRGQVSDASMFFALQALDVALLGLIPEEYSVWASETRKQLNLSEPDKVRTFLSDERLAVIKLYRSEGKVEVNLIARIEGSKPVNKIETNEEAVDVHRWAEEHFKALTYGLIKRGFTEL
jgi:hypothetical protein